MAYSYTCPYCGQPTTITTPNYSNNFQVLKTEKSKHGIICLHHIAIACPNINCQELSLNIRLCSYGRPQNSIAGSYGPQETIYDWKLLPRSRARPQPDYIPEEIRNNYREACLILSDSPKASAAMSRRCLQGIVRNFWDIPMKKRGNLGAELNYVKDLVAHDTWEGIEAIRTVGDIGAHMEKSVDTIVDIEPHEAELLVELIETLLEDWYVTRYNRKQRTEKLGRIVVEKRNSQKISKERAKETNSESDE